MAPHNKTPAYTYKHALQGVRVKENEELRRAFFQEATQPNSLNHISSEVACYRGHRKNPTWMDLEPGMYQLSARNKALILMCYPLESFSTLCTIHADTSRVAKQKRQGVNGVYYTQTFDIVLSCGLTEMKAQISWKENVSRTIQ